MIYTLPVHLLLLLVGKPTPLAVQVTALEEEERERGDGEAEEGAEHEGVLCSESVEHLRREEREGCDDGERSGGNRRRKGRRRERTGCKTGSHRRVRRHRGGSDGAVRVDEVGEDCSEAEHDAESEEGGGDEGDDPVNGRYSRVRFVQFGWMGRGVTKGRTVSREGEPEERKGADDGAVKTLAKVLFRRRTTTEFLRLAEVDPEKAY